MGGYIISFKVRKLLSGHLYILFLDIFNTTKGQRNGNQFIQWGGESQIRTGVNSVRHSYY